MAHREFKDWLKAYMDYAEKISETPFNMLHWAGISAVAGALQRKVFIDQGRYQLYPNFFIVFVADAGVIQKSTTINTALGLLRKVEGINFAPDATTWEGFIKFMEDNHISDNILTEDLNAAQTKTSAITIVASELSVFLDPENKFMLSALTKLWDCEDTFVKLTKFSGTEEIEKPCLNLIGGTTPAWMRESFDRWSREGGFVSRTIFIFGAKKRQLLAFPRKHITPETEKTKAKLVRDLNAISCLRGEYSISPKTMEIGEVWYEKHNEAVTHPEYIDSSGFKDRKQSHVLKLAMVLAASRGESLVITPELWAEALVLIDDAEKDFPKAFSTTDDRIELRPYFEILKAIKAAGEIERSRLFSKFTSRFMVREMASALDSMSQARLIEKVNKTNGDTFIKYIGEKADE